MEASLKTSMPWLVLAGSGGVSDFLSDLLENLSSAPVFQSFSEDDSDAGLSVDLKEKVTKRVKKYFADEPETDKLVEQVSFVQTKYTLLYNIPDLLLPPHSASSHIKKKHLNNSQLLSPTYQFLFNFFVFV